VLKVCLGRQTVGVQCRFGPRFTTDDGFSIVDNLIVSGGRISATGDHGGSWIGSGEATFGRLQVHNLRIAGGLIEANSLDGGSGVSSRRSGGGESLVRRSGRTLRRAGLVSVPVPVPVSVPVPVMRLTARLQSVT
jgi:hypothetical protein